MSSTHDRTAWLEGGNACCTTPPHQTNRPYRLLLLGAPGVGKGTQAELLCERLGTCHLSTGDVFRVAKCDASGELSPAMQEALTYMKRGDLVPDRTVLEMIRERARCLRCTGGFLLDGFPRTLTQAEALTTILDAENIRLDNVLNYELPIEKIVERLSGRRTCTGCKAVFHITARPPKVENKCDHCGHALYRRDDDRPEAILVRMKVYQESTKPLLDYYAQRGLLLTIMAEGTPEETCERTMERLNVIGI